MFKTPTLCSLFCLFLSLLGGGAPFVYNLKKIAQVYCVLILIDKHKGTKGQIYFVISLQIDRQMIFI